MFAPEGYLSWSELLEVTNSLGLALAIIEMARRRKMSLVEMSDQFGHKPVWNVILALPNTNLSYDDARATERLLFAWIQSNLMLRYPPLICSAAGQIVQSTPSIFAHADKLFWCPWEWEELDRNAYWGRLYQAEKTQPDATGYRFAAFDPTTGIITRKNHQIQLLSSALDIGGNKAAAENIFRDLIEPFIGYSLCWAKDGIPNDWRSLLDCLPIELSEEELSAFDSHSSPQEMRPKGRPPKWRVAAEAYFELFEDGSHGPLQWEQVLKKLRSHCGISVTAETLRKGISLVKLERNKEKPND